MPEPETSKPIPVDDPANALATAAGPEEGVEAEPEPEPEPMTPQRVSQWNAYYDIYVKWAALILVFMVACNYVTDPQVWLHLKTGQLIAKQAAPIKTDQFSYTEYGQPWYNIPWLFEWANALLYQFIYGLVPVDSADPTANQPRAEQIAIGTLVALSALVRFLTAFIILQFRHRGPGLWWAAICMTAVLGVIYHPLVGTFLGGIAGPSFISPSTWGLFFLALELWILFGAFFQAKGFGLWLLVPLFLLWVNVDESFLYGLVVLAASSVGYLIDRGRIDVLLERPGDSGDADDDDDHAGAKPDGHEVKPVGAAVPVALVAVCALVCLANPSTWHAFRVAAAPFFHFLRSGDTVTTSDQLSFFNAEFRSKLGADWYLLLAYYLGVVSVGLGSFLLNVRRFSWARFVPFAVMAALWLLVMHANAAFALVFAWVVVPNGQEWYQDRFGTRGRLGGRWTAWSTGGRIVTLAVIFLMMGKDITGWGNASPDLQFGFGFHPDAFALQAADFLDRHNEITGKILNTSMHQGDLMIWKSGTKRQTYVDGRTRFFPQEVLERWHETRRALADDDVAAWKPLLDKYEISVVMIDPADAQNTHRRLRQSPNWIAFYDDGQIMMFGRADAPASDVAFFKANVLDADVQAYVRNHVIAGAERPPNPTSLLDRIFQNRTLSRPQSRTKSAARWLARPEGNDPRPYIPDPAHCLLAIQEARTALAHSPDDWIAFRILKDAYRYLMVQENAMLAGIPITRESAERIAAQQPTMEFLMHRMQQRATALNYAIMTTPPPRTKDERVELAGLNMELFQLYYQTGARDLARNRLKAVVEGFEPGDYNKEEKADLEMKLSELDKAVKEADDKVSDFELERSANPVDKSMMALNQGNTGRAIDDLAQAERDLVSTAVVKPRLVDLYCNTGQPEKALDLFAVGAVEDPNLGVEPGSGAFRQGRVYFLLGNYLSAATLWHERAIPRVRAERSGRVLAAATGLTRGDPLPTTNAYMALPTSLGQQATWLYDLGLCQLEAGLPANAAESFSKALTLAPSLGVRLIAVYYLEKMGKPVPPPAKAIGSKETAGAAPRTGALKEGEILPPPAIGPPTGTPKAGATEKPSAEPKASVKEKPEPPAAKDAGAAAAKKSGS